MERVLKAHDLKLVADWVVPFLAVLRCPTRLANLSRNLERAFVGLRPRVCEKDFRSRVGRGAAGFPPKTTGLLRERYK